MPDDDGKLSLPHWLGRRIIGRLRDNLGSPPWSAALQDPKLLAAKAFIIILKRVIPPTPKYRDLRGLPPYLAEPLDALSPEAGITSRARQVRDILRKWFRDGIIPNGDAGIELSSPTHHVDP